MSAPNRSTLISATQKVLKKHYKPITADVKRSVLENLLFGCLLDSAKYSDAEAAWTVLLDEFFDWNEIRVATSRELAEFFPMLTNPIAAADRLRQALQNVFEGLYSYDLEPLQKENLGKATQRLASFAKLSPFAVSYVVQHSLGGHSIPLDDGTMQLMLILDIVTEKEAKQHRVPGLERAVPKSKGKEYGSLLHQLSAEFVANSYGTAVHKILLEINPEAKARLPKRSTKTAKKPTKKAAKTSKSAKSKSAATKATKKTKTATAKSKKTAKTKTAKSKTATGTKTTVKKKTKTKRKPR
ncbi:MAG: DCN1-like protein [Pirellulales bacterium]|nr:DCN1-like protein [Pirellulales bacterium]